MSLASGSIAQQADTDSPGSTLQAPAPNETSGPNSDQDSVERFAAHGQATFLEQLTAPFHAPYSAANSLSPRHGAETIDVTLFLGTRLWPGAEARINPEIDQGFWLDD